MQVPKFRDFINEAKKPKDNDPITVVVITKSSPKVRRQKTGNKKIKKETGILILEDAAESLGSTFQNKQSGTFGDFGTFSLQATKAITTGEGGLVVTNNSKIFDNFY